MTNYLLSIYQPDGEPPPPEELEPIMRNVRAFIEETKAAGAWVFNGGLGAPGASTVLRLEGAVVTTTDGPFVEAKEHVGGFLIVKAPDIEGALEWGRRAARAVTLPIEVRPFQDEPVG